MTPQFNIFILSAAFAVCLGMNTTSPAGGSQNAGNVRIYFPQRPGEARRGETEAPLIKEDPSEVEEFPLIDKQVVSDHRKGQQPFPNDPFNPNTFGFNPNPNTIGFNPNHNGGGNPGFFGTDLEAFTVRRAVDHEIIPGSKVKFLDTVTHIGNGWREGLNEFVCDTPGIFFFTFTIMGERYRHFRVTLKHNGIGVVSAYGDVNGYQMATNSAVLRLLARDRVYLDLQEGGIYEVTTLTGRAYNTFSGFRIL